MQAKSARSQHSNKSSQHTNHSSTKSIQIQQKLPLYSFTSLHPIITKKLLAQKHCPLLPKTDVQDRAFGAMFGLLIGDALGSHVLNKIPTI